MKKLEIIVPHYNGAHLIHNLLDSVPQKSWLSVTVVDDHSSEEQFSNLCKVCENYGFVRVLQGHQGKKGPGEARNKGIQESQADWLLFADVDDYYTANAFDILCQYLERPVDMVFFPHTSVIEETGELGKRHLYYKKLIQKYIRTQDDKLFYKFYSPCSKLVRRNLLSQNSIQFDGGIGGEDNNFSLKCAYYAKHIDVSEKVIYCIVESQQSMTAHYSDQVLINHFEAMSRFNDFLQSKGEFAYQAPMLGWIVRGRQISVWTAFKWFWRSFKKGYPISPHHYF